ncbi:TraM recognition domain-containing protein (plasmid) [Myxococcus sp. MxC21-1]|uniref:type IV secretory system conjugative DNA transfer family protein n=1 Tax=Myxococcus sp. MxC21-1 TaxID=3041439 RepID=UPI002931EBD9|nr:TraM recognition domain-containing protein [Myxococcus sp. MxC21-1]WNZ66241.1 TraM recognition domain-containing protein [Myxococcus sp. MxC21-1]
MSNKDVKAEGPPDSVSPLSQFLLLSLCLVALLELTLRNNPASTLSPNPIVSLPYRLLAPLLPAYLSVRQWCVERPFLAGALFLAALTLFLVAYRYGLIVWYNHLLPAVTGLQLLPESTQFKQLHYDLIAEIKKRPPGSKFVGLTPVRGRFGLTTWTPLYITDEEQTMHRHVLGETGSGKTASVIWPSVLQDLLDGNGVLVISAKGSDEEIIEIKALCAVSSRVPQLRVFALPAWNDDTIWSHRYNMVWVRPRRVELTGTGAVSKVIHPGDDPVPVAQRVISVLTLGENQFYDTQAEIMWTNMCRLLHGMVDAQGNGLIFTMRDLAVCLKGIGNTGAYLQALNHCLSKSLDREAAREIAAQIANLGKDVQKCMSGLIGAVDKFRSPLVNAYNPDFTFEDLLERDQVLYAQLPSNLYPIQAPALGKVLLMDLQQQASLRQVHRTTRNQRFFGAHVDEFYTFAEMRIIDSLNKLRDANVRFLLAHQSIADLELVSKEFATGVWDNTLWKDVLRQGNPALCEQVAKSIGTHQVHQSTVRRQQGALFTSLLTGDASVKLVETFRLHPNQIKNLARRGQGWCVTKQGPVPVNYSRLPKLPGSFPLSRNVQAGTRGLRLEERFLNATPFDADGTPSTTSPANSLGKSRTAPPPVVNP